MSMDPSKFLQYVCVTNDDQRGHQLINIYNQNNAVYTETIKATPIILVLFFLIEAQNLTNYGREI